MFSKPSKVEPTNFFTMHIRHRPISKKRRLIHTICLVHLSICQWVPSSVWLCLCDVSHSKLEVTEVRWLSDRAVCLKPSKYTNALC